jgi:hypothetical protein
MLSLSLNVSLVPTNSLPQWLRPCPLVRVNVLLNVPRQLVGILRASVPLFKDMPSFKDFKGQVEELVHKLDGYQKDQFQVPTRACTHPYQSCVPSLCCSTHDLCQPSTAPVTPSTTCLPSLSWLASVPQLLFVALLGSLVVSASHYFQLFCSLSSPPIPLFVLCTGLGGHNHRGP